MNGLRTGQPLRPHGVVYELRVRKSLLVLKLEHRRKRKEARRFENRKCYCYIYNKRCYFTGDWYHAVRERYVS